MMKIAIVFVLVALAGAPIFGQLTSMIEPERRFYEIRAVNKSGKSVGNLILRQRGNYGNFVAVDSELNGLPSGQYFGLYHNYDGNFDGTCDMTSSPLRVRNMDGSLQKGVAFGVINVDNYNHAVTMYSNKQNAVEDMHTMFFNKLVYIYPVPWNSKKPLNEFIDNYDAPLPTPVACGLPKFMPEDHPDRPKFIKVDAEEAKSDLGEMIENVLGLISDNKEQIVMEFLTFFSTAMTALGSSS